MEANPFLDALKEEEPPIRGKGPSGINPKWVVWYRAHTRVSTNIAIRVGLRTLREQRVALSVTGM